MAKRPRKALPPEAETNELAASQERDNLNALIAGCDQAKLEQVFQWFLTGANEFQVIEAIRAAWPEDDAEPLLVAAFARLVVSNTQITENPESIRGWCFEATRAVYQKAMMTGDLETALRAVRQITQMLGKK